MPKEKQYVFSARTTAEGLAILNGIRSEKGITWDTLVIEAVNAHWGVEVPMPARVGPMPEERAALKASKAAEEAERAEARAKAAAERKDAKEAEKAAKAKADKVKVYNSKDELIRAEDAKGRPVEPAAVK